MNSQTSKPRGVVITGGAGAIGIEICRGFITQGDRVLIVDRNPNAPEIAKETSCDERSPEVLVADLSDRDTVIRCVKSARDFGCDVLVNCVGISPRRDGQPIPPDEVEIDGWQLTLWVNLTVPFLFCRGMLPDMRQRGFGRIINLSSRAGRTYAAPSGADYAASKAGLLGLTRTIAGYYGPYGITANCIAPGRVDTALSNTSSASTIRQALEAIPVRRLGTPFDISTVALFLAREDTGYINGACMDVNGGSLMI